VLALILFTSDLDRTLIYSGNMMKTHPVENEVIPVEYKEDKIITYMTGESIKLLQRFNQEHIFVPVTTRAMYQYERISVFQEEIKPKFAVASNGGTILIDGKVDQDWDHFIRRRLQATSAPKEDMLQLFSKIRHDQWVEREFEVDHFFYMFHINKELIPQSEIGHFEAELNKCGWRMFLYGRKLYLLPDHLNKALAVSRIQTYVGYDLHVAAGDSLIDYDMIVQAEYGYSPAHGELHERKEHDSKVNWLNRNGAGSAEELLQIILKLQTQ
jgi:hydroxymethylpyrimidine pyrophosphatase-like HAD family hydrolase